MSRLKPEVRKRVAVAALVLAALASIVSGREQPQPAAPAERNAASGDRAASEESLAGVDLAKLKRERHNEPVKDLLAPPRPVPAPTAAAPQAPDGPPPAPVAPPLPFAYVGKVVDGGKTTVFVGRGGEHYEVAAGAMIDQYQVERVTDHEISFVYRPLGARQVLAVPQPGEAAAAR